MVHNLQGGGATFLSADIYSVVEKGVATSNSSSFCPFPFEFLSVNKTSDIHLSNVLKSSGGGWIFSNQVTKVTLEIN